MLIAHVLRSPPPFFHTHTHTHTHIHIVAVDALFAMVDLDGSGSIDKDELRETLASLGFKLDLSELEAVFREVDTDMSGTIDKQELSSFLSKNLGDC